MYINFWYAAERSERITDQPVGVRMLGRDFVLFRDGTGTVRCLANVCIHRGGSLAGGRVVDGCVQCPYHGWRFDGDGICTRIPSLGPDPRIPARARVDSYPTVERYGLVHVFLGDLPEEERPGIMEIPEFGQPGWMAHYEDYVQELDYRRTVENGLDPAHNEFVHTTHGFSGTPDAPRVPDYELQEHDWGCGFITQYVSPPLADERMKEASGRKQDAVVEAGTFHHGPSNMITYIRPTKDVRIHQNVFKTPVDESHVRTFLVQTRNFLIGPEHHDRFAQRNAFVRNQDVVVLTGLQPFMNPETNSRELLVPADRAVVRYRQYLREWQARGWRIDAEAAERRARHEALVIPSPARRESPRGWVLETVPLMPASAVVTGSTDHTTDLNVASGSNPSVA
jgi:phenylpropionate dioxygenase-like ring-hydroxylating dioxygenase large terminal subunit